MEVTETVLLHVTPAIVTNLQNLKTLLESFDATGDNKRVCTFRFLEAVHY